MLIALFNPLTSHAYQMAIVTTHHIIIYTKFCRHLLYG